MAGEYFEVKTILDHFKNALAEDDNVSLQGYLEAFKHLNTFCSLMGSVFGFVADEIIEKSVILNNLRNNDVNNNYNSIKEMIKHETDNDLLKKTDFTNGCRTLLRLHRGLDFIRNFLRKVHNCPEDSATGKIGQAVYAETLAKYHGWLIRTGANMALYFLPNKKVLFEKISGDNLEENVEFLPQMLEIADKVYERTEKCYKNNDLLGLP